MSAIDILPPLRDVIAHYELRTRKALGQHFLYDLNLTRRIAETAGNLDGCTVFEIGPGPGGLTRALLATKAKKIIAIEKDPRCIAALESLVTAADGRLEVIEADALKIDLPKLTLSSHTPHPTSPSRGEEPVALPHKSAVSKKEPKSPPPLEGGVRGGVDARIPSASNLKIVANLPYNIGTELLLGWLRQIDEFKSLTLMFQKEVAERLTAKPGSKAYGRLSVIAQFCCTVEHALNIPAKAFTPPPKVDSTVVHLTPRKNRPKNISFDDIGKVTASAFGQRRKMLRSSLKPLGGEELLKRAGINPELRAENLSVEDFVELAKQTKN